MISKQTMSIIMLIDMSKRISYEKVKKSASTQGEYHTLFCHDHAELLSNLHIFARLNMRPVKTHVNTIAHADIYQTIGGVIA